MPGVSAAGSADPGSGCGRSRHVWNMVLSFCINAGMNKTVMKKDCYLHGLFCPEAASRLNRSIHACWTREQPFLSTACCQLIGKLPRSWLRIMHPSSMHKAHDMRNNSRKGHDCTKPRLEQLKAEFFKCFQPERLATVPAVCPNGQSGYHSVFQNVTAPRLCRNVQSG